jgi:hypothetical protein
LVGEYPACNDWRWYLRLGTLLFSELLRLEDEREIQEPAAMVSDRLVSSTGAVDDVNRLH